MKVIGVLTLCYVILFSGHVFAQKITTYRASFQEPEITEVEHGYSRVTIEGLGNMGSGGEPSLPAKAVKLLVPYMSEVESVEVLPGRQIPIDGNYIVEPAQRPIPLSYNGVVKPTDPDPKIYESSKSYPTELSTEVGTFVEKGYSIFYLNLHPVRYNPAGGLLSYYEDMTIKVITREAPRKPGVLPSKAADAGEIAKIVDNPAMVESYLEKGEAEPPVRSSLPPGSYVHVIITSPALSSGFEPLVEHRVAQGKSSTIITTDYIYENYDGTRPDGDTDDQTKIRNFIRDAYQNWGTEYILLGGDSNTVPPRMFWVESWHDFYPEIDTMPSDMYYACLDGEFDEDEDSNYGEDPLNNDHGVDEADLLAEVAVGRAPVAYLDGDDPLAEVRNFVNKTITYETSPPVDYLHSAYMVGEELGFGGISEYAGPSMEEIRLGSCEHGYCTEGFASSYFFETGALYDSPSSTWEKLDLMDMMDGSVHIFNHLGHSNYRYTMKIYAWELDLLENDDYFFVYSQGCMPGGFDTDECFAEVLTTIEHGAFATVMNARYGWGTSNSTDGPSQRFDREFWDAFFSDGHRELGNMNNSSKEAFTGSIAEDCMRWCTYELNLFGDPATTILEVDARGVVSLDSPYYTSIPSTICITLADTDLNQDPDVAESAVVDIESTTESLPEEVTLTETGLDTSIFQGYIDLVSGDPDPVPDDGKLQSAHGDTITVTYEDNDDGSDGPAISTDTAVVDLVPPEITGAGSEGGCTRAKIEWVTDEPADSIVYYGTDPEDLSLSEEDLELVTEHVVILNELEPLTTYYFDVVSRDGAGHITRDDNGGSHYSFTTVERVYRYVSVTGSDENEGSRDFPWRTIGYAISTVTDDCLCPPLILVSAGTYSERITMQEHVELYGGYNPSDWTWDPVANETVIDGGGEGSVVTFYFLEGEDIVLSGFTIRNGYSGDSGGGIFCYNASPTITNNTIVDNWARCGGGLICLYSSAVLTDNTISNNGALGGGGMYIDMSCLTIRDSIMARNTADVDGGGILCYDTLLELKNNDMTENTASNGGGGALYSWSSTFDIVDNTITGNSALLWGGGIFYCWSCVGELRDNLIADNEANWGGGIWLEESSNPILIGNVIEGNRAVHPVRGNGGGIYCLHSSPVLDANIIRHNTAGMEGGGIFVYFNASPVIANCIVENNSAVVSGGGMYLSSCSPEITNTTIALNSALYEGAGVCCAWDAFPIIKNSILWRNSSNSDQQIYKSDDSDPLVTYSCVDGGWDGEGNIDVHPRFLEPFAGDFHLMHNSPCIDAGTGEGAPDVDFEGDERPSGSGYDMGADEVVEFVDTDGDGMPDWWEDKYFPDSDPEPGDDPDGDGLTNLEEYQNGSNPREADTDGDGLNDYDEVYVYHTYPNDQDTDGDGMDDGWEVEYGLDPLNLEDAQWDADNDGYTNLDEYLYGTDPNNPGSYPGPREIYVDDDAPYDPGNPLEDGSEEHPFDTIQEGIDYTWFPGDTVIVKPGTYCENIVFNGQAITVRSSNPDDPETVAATIIDGGGNDTVVSFNLDEGRSTILDGLTIRNGNASSGGGIMCTNRSSPTIRNNLVVDNQAELYGGGIYCYRDSSALIINNTIKGNTVSRYGGGGISLYISTSDIVNNTIAGNTCEGYGGGIYVLSASPAITNNTITNNSAEEGGGISISYSSPLVKNSVLWGNVADIDPQINKGGYSTLSITYSCIEGGYGGTANIAKDPLFADYIGDNFHLTRWSPCRNRGTSEGSPELDFEGEERPNPEDGLVDMSADEWHFLSTDDDGPEGELGDYWEIHYFGDLGEDAGGDYDNDGYTNLEEYENGTDPTEYDLPSTPTPTQTQSPTLTPTPTVTPTATWSSRLAYTSFEEPQSQDPIGYTLSGSVPDNPGADAWGRWRTVPRTGSYSFAAQDCSGDGQCTFDTIDIGGYTGVVVHLWLRTNGDFEGGDYARAYVRVDGVSQPYFFNLTADQLDNRPYEEYTYAIPDGSSSIVIVYEVRDSANTEHIYIDDVEVTAVQPLVEPTSTPTMTPSATVTPTPTQSATPTPWSFPVRMNFQPALAPTPEGYFRDDGSPYGTHGRYGWR